mmetsp:Transcript_10517/g.15836  ORF Transcript_10517/g.15836 Transcript_10517/m.15836 type:complete len:481 (-) Transcript_10517:262-1704(-)
MEAEQSSSSFSFTSAATDAAVQNMAISTSATTENEESEVPVMRTTLTAKYGKQTITIPDLPSHTTTIATVKNMIMEKTNILPKRQKFIGLTLKKDATVISSTNDGNNDNIAKRRCKMIQDEHTLDQIAIKKPNDCTKNETTGEILHAHHAFILMGTPETEIFIDPDDISASANGGNNVVNDFDIDFNIGSSEWKEHFVNKQNLIKFTNSTEVHIMNPPREGKKLMVLDLDHTLLDFSSRKIVNAASASAGGTSTDTSGNATISSTDAVASSVAGGAGAGAATGGNAPSNSNARSVQDTINQMKRPFMDEFLAQMYVHYDLVVWSQTSWRWLETKLVELGMLTNPNYRFCFVLDKTSMFAITSTRRSGQKIKHYVKPLQIIWSKFPKVWDASNTIHLDDLSRNFALNIENGLKVTGFYRKKKKSGGRTVGGNPNKDVELVGLIGYCTKLAKEVNDFRDVDFKYWKDVVNGTKGFDDKKGMN